MHINQSYMCYDLAGSVGSRQHWLWDIATKRNEFLLFNFFSIVLRTVQLLITLEPLDRFKWGFQQIAPLQVSTSIEKWLSTIKCVIMSDVESAGKFLVLCTGCPNKHDNNNNKALSALHTEGLSALYKTKAASFCNIQNMITMLPQYVVE